MFILTNSNAQQTYLEIADENTYLLVPPSPEDSLARQIFTGLQRGHLDPSLLSDDLKHYLVPERLLDFSSSLSPLGSPQAFSLLSEETVYRLTTRNYDVIAGGKKLRLHLLLLADHTLQDVTMNPAD